MHKKVRYYGSQYASQPDTLARTSYNLSHPLSVASQYLSLREGGHRERLDLVHGRIPTPEETNSLIFA